MPGPARKPEPDRFWPKVKKTKSCWVWTASINNAGYGRFEVWRDDKWKTVFAHRWVWEQEHGPILGGLEIDHLCSNKRCVRPSHLRLVTPSENKQRWSTEERTHCLNGHPLPEERELGYQCPTCLEWERAVDNIRHQERAS